jgi:hypothetical protein
MENDDVLVGRVLSRREALALLGAAGGALLMGSFSGAAQSELAGIVSPSCAVRPEQEDGPYFIDEQLNRSDIRSDPTNGAIKPGVPLALGSWCTASTVGAAGRSQMRWSISGSATRSAPIQMFTMDASIRSAGNSFVASSGPTRPAPHGL